MNRKSARRAGNPVEFAVMKSKLQADINSLLTAAELQATWGDSPEKTVERCNRVLFVVAFAVGRHRIPDDLPEVRILRAMANVVCELARDHRRLEQQRGALTSGLQAAQRLIPRLSVWSLGEGSLVFDHLRKSGIRPQAMDFDQLMRAPAALPAAA